MVLRSQMKTEEEVVLHLRESEHAMERAAEEREQEVHALMKDREREEEDLKEVTWSRCYHGYPM